MAVLADLSRDQLLALVAKMQANGQAERKLSLKVSKQGAVQINGLRRFPVTFYANEWERLIEIVPEIKQFIADNADTLARKNED